MSKGGEFSHNQFHQSQLGLSWKKGNPSWTTTAYSLVVNWPVPGQACFFLAPVIHYWLSPWVAWFFPFQFVVCNSGEVPRYQFCWASHSGCQETGIKYNSFGAMLTAVVFEEVCSSQSQTQERGDPQQGQYSDLLGELHHPTTTCVCACLCTCAYIYTGSGLVISKPGRIFRQCLV